MFSGLKSSMPEMPTMEAFKIPAWTATQKRSQSPDDDQEKKRFKTVGQYTTVTGLNMLTLESVGLVVGLDGTGDDPPPSSYRKQMLDEMRKRNVKNPNQILRSPNTALVIVRAYLPPLVKKGDRFDVEIRIPGSSEATSLNGGVLLETRLSEQAMVAGRGVLKGHIMAKAAGPVLVSTGQGNKDSLSGVLKRGRILGGGLSLTNRKLSMYLRSDYRSVRNAQRAARQIGKRFHRYNRYGTKEPLATAKTDQKLELDIVARYKNNYPRYLQVIRQIAWVESDVEQGIRIKKLEKKLQNAVTAERAALSLEAIGKRGIVPLKKGLKAKTLESRFHAAVALAYLGEPEGLEVLAEAAKKEPAFRVFAYAAMAASEEPEANILLHNLMSEQSAETRYGAFRALSVLDKNDPFIYGELLNKQFRLHEVRTTGKPMVHLTHHKKAEIVLFGAEQKFETPIVMRAGKNILITAQSGSNQVTVNRFSANAPDKKRTVSTSVGEVIRAAAELGATYPDIAAMLSQADSQTLLQGSIVLDALPQAGRVYHRPTVAGSSLHRKKTHVGRTTTAPNMFAFFEDKSDKGTASAADMTSEKNDEDEPDDTENKNAEDQRTENNNKAETESDLPPSQKKPSPWEGMKNWFKLPENPFNNPFNRPPEQSEPDV